ncbi:MAG: NAD(P)H-dependent oxidoreductase [Candidatus Velthaea sp.]
MATLLYIEASPRKTQSASIDVARTYLNTYRSTHPNDTIDTMDVWNMALPEFNSAMLAAKYAALDGNERTPVQAAAWNVLSTLAERVRVADQLLFAVPMWNFGIPYKLKQLIDVISQKDLLFTFDERGFGGLAAAKKAIVVYARGIDYGPASAFDTPAAEWDQQKPYLELWLRFIGVTDISTIVAEKTLMGPDAHDAALLAARAEAVKLAGRT